MYIYIYTHTHILPVKSTWPCSKYFISYLNSVIFIETSIIMFLFIILNTSLPQYFWPYYNQISFEKLIWRHFSSLVLNRNKMLSKSDIIAPLELILDYIVLTSCLLDTTCFTYTEENFIRVASLCDRRLTTANITAQLNQCHEKNVSTARRRFCEAGLDGRIDVKKPQLRKQNSVKRLQWVKAHKDWTIEQWNKVLWTDESKFKIFGSNWRVYMQQRVGKRAATPCITPAVKHRWGSVMV